MNVVRATVLATAAAAALLMACSSGDGTSEPSTDSTSDALRHKGCVQNVMCINGDVWDSKSCQCVPDTRVQCGTKTCGIGEYCCSSSCGICERIGAMCPAIACPTP